MAGLATAIGLGGELPSKYSGDAEIIRQTGEGISGSIQRAGAGVNAGLQTVNQQKKEKDKYLVPFSTNINALEKDQKEYAGLASDLTAEIRAAADNGASAAQLRDMQVKAVDTLANAKEHYEGNLEAFVLAQKTSQDPTKDISEFNRFVTQGGYNETEVYQEGNVGAGPVAPRSGAPYAEGQEQIPGEMKSKRTGVPYFEMTISEQKKLAPGGLKAKLFELTKDATGSFDKAATETFGQNNLEFLVKRTYTKKNGVGGYEFEIDPEQTASALNTFLAQRGRTDNVEVKKYWNTLTRAFENKGKDAGLAGEELKSWVDAGVKAAATQEFMKNLEAAKIKRMSEDKETVDKEGKGMTIIVGGGGSSVSDGKNAVNFVLENVPNEDAIPASNKQKIKENNDLIASYMAKKKAGVPENAAAAYDRAIATLENNNKELSKRRNKNYFDFSSVINSEDAGISFIGSDGKERLMSPQEIFKDQETGEIMLGGKVKSKIEESVPDARGNPTKKKVVSSVEEDFSVPFNDQNKSRLFVNKPQLEPMFEKLDWSLLDGPKAKKQEGKVSYPKSKSDFDKLPSGSQYVKPGETTVRIKP